MEAARGAELEADLGEDLANEAAVAVNGAGEHGGAGGAANGGGWLGGAYAGEERSALEEVVGHGLETGGDDAADIVAFFREDIEGDGGAEIDDDGRGAIKVADGGGIREPICADAGGARVIDADAEGKARAEGKEMAVRGVG